MKVRMCCKERIWSSCEKHTRGYSRVLNKYVIKENECSSKLLELNVVCAVGRGEYGHGENFTG